MPPVSSNTTPNNQNGNNSYRFFNVQKEGRKDTKDRSIKETTGNVAGNSLKATGTTIQAAGTGLRAAGAATKATGAGVTAVGAGLSATGIGAVAGAPIAAVGRVIGAGGTAMGAAGKATSRIGGSIRKAGTRLKSVTKKTTSVAKIASPVQSKLLAWVILGTLLSMWFLQFSASLFSLGFLGLASGLSFAGNLSELLGQALDWVNSIISSTTGLNLNPAEHMASLFVFFNIISFIIGICSLFFVALLALFTAKSPFWGRAASIKISVFILSFVFLAFPLFNMIPWSIIYMLVINNLDD